MPEHVLISKIEIITDGGRRRRWGVAEKLRIVEETLDNGARISVVAETLDVAQPNLKRSAERENDDAAAPI